MRKILVFTFAIFLSLSCNNKEDKRIKKDFGNDNDQKKKNNIIVNPNKTENDNHYFTIINDYLNQKSIKNVVVVAVLNTKSNQKIYIIKGSLIKDTVNYRYFGVILDVKTKHFSKDPIIFRQDLLESLESGFNNDLVILERPIYYLKDMDNDGAEELIIKERVHNGTLYNAVIDRIFKLNYTEMSINYIFSMETLSFHPIYNEYISRIVENKKVKVYAYSINSKNNKKTIGTFDITLDKSNKIIPSNINIFMPEYEGLVFTCSPKGIIFEPDIINTKLSQLLQIHK